MQSVCDAAGLQVVTFPWHVIQSIKFMETVTRYETQAWIGHMMHFIHM